MRLGCVFKGSRGLRSGCHLNPECVQRCTCTGQKLHPEMFAEGSKLG